MAVDAQSMAVPSGGTQANGEGAAPSSRAAASPTVAPVPSSTTVPKPPVDSPIKILARPDSAPPVAELASQLVALTLNPVPPRSNDATSPGTTAPRDKQVTLLRRTSSHRRSSSAGDGLTAGVGGGEGRAPRASSEGRGSRALSAASDGSYRRTESESVSSSPDLVVGPSTGVTTPNRSASTELEESTTALEEGGEGEQGGNEGVVLDAALMAALALPRDRFLLLRAETELERFLMDPTMSRLPLSPPYFPPALNSYQRLLIHRLADTFGITREVEPMSPSVWAATTSSSNIMNVPTGIVVLVKGDSTKMPLVKLATIVPAPTVSPLPTITSTPTNGSSPIHSITPSPASSLAYLPLPGAQAQPQFFKILPRTSHRPTSSASSSVGADEEGKGKGRKEMTLEEREAAYKEARERIFKQEAEEKGEVDEPTKLASIGGGIARPSSAGSTYSRSSAMSLAGGRPSPSVVSETSSVYSSVHSGFQQGGAGSSGATVYYPQHSPQMRMMHAAQGINPSLRPSAPSFDPRIGAWTAPNAYFGYSDEPHHPQQDYPRSYGGDGQQYGSSGEWTRPQSHQQGQPQQHPHQQPPQHRQPPPQHSQPPWNHPSSRSAMPGHPQLPIQVTAPSPLPQHATWASSSAPLPPSQSPITPSASYATQYPPYASSSPYASPSQSDSFHPPPPAAWARQPPLSSPALSTTSSGGSSYPAATPLSQPAALDRAGYVMRFAEGGVVGVSSRSASSLSSVSSSSTSRTASSTNMSSVARSGLGGERGERKAGHSASPSFGSVVSGSTEDRVSAGGSPRGSGSGSGSGGSEKGKGREEGEGAGGGKDGVERKSADRSTTTPLHPSLPAKPSWVTKPAASDRSTSDRSTSQGSDRPASSLDTGSRRTFPLTSSAPVSHPHTPPVQSYGHYPPPHDPNAAYYDQRRPPPTPSYPSYSPANPPSSYYARQPPPTQQQQQWWDPAQSSPHPPPANPYYSTYESTSYPRDPPPSSLSSYQYEGEETRSREAELRRPAPRSTALYDPNRAAAEEGKKRSASVPGSREGGEGLRS